MAPRHLIRIVVALALVAILVIFYPFGDTVEELPDDATAELPATSDEAANLPGPDGWMPAELAKVQSLSLRNLAPLADSESNRYAQDEQAARLGQRLFFDKRLSSNGNVSCASCHQPERQFSDGIPLGVGVDVVDRHTMSLIGVAYSPWLFWDGRADSLWRQALGPLEDAREHGGTRTQYAHVIAGFYQDEYEAAFKTSLPIESLQQLPPSAGPLGTLDELKAWQQMTEHDRDQVNRIFANIGKAMDAYQRRLMPRPTRFDAYVDALYDKDDSRAHELLSEEERLGLALFIDRADCMHCHNGPLFSNNDFHNTAIATETEATLAEGRVRGAHRVLQGEFSCLGQYSDASEEACEELRYIKTSGDDLMSAFRTPGLRNVALTAPYMHNGKFQTLEQVIDHYVDAPPSILGTSELTPLDLSPEEKAQLVAFLRSLNEQEPTAPDRWRGTPD